MADLAVVRRRLDGAGQLVRRALFEPVSAWPVAICRIVLGLALLAWTVTLMLDAGTFLADDGLVPPELADDGWRWFALDSTATAWVALVLLLVCAVAVTIGFRPTPFLLVAFVLSVAIQRRNPIIINSGDLILRDLTLLLALTPSAAALSVDRWRAHGRPSLRTAPRIAPWGLRLLQLQVTVVYFFAFWGKRGDLWWEGTAVSTALRLDDLQRFGRLDLVVGNVPIVAALTWGTLAAELALALFLWWRRARPTLIVVGILLHVSIGATMLVGFFGPAMFAGLACFLDGDAVQRRLDARGSARTAQDAPDVAPT